VPKISVSQIETFDACNRKWWHERVMKRGQAERTNVFGVVLHACLERAQKGQLAFPTGWECSYDRYTGQETGRLTNTQQSQVKILVQRAKDAGWLDLKPGSKIEHEFKVPLGDDTLIGFIDVVQPESGGVEDCECDDCNTTSGLPSVDDHKSTAAMKWAEDETSLADNTQLLVYAKVVHPQAEHVVLRHNIFCKEPLSIKRVEVTVNRERIDKEWDRITGLAAKMTALRGVTDIEQVEANPRECSNWGGCPFRHHCFPEDEY